ncbi:hypothetical protein BU200_09715 [Streptococcus acidominimus]|uniref:Uncharacterized protein n=2 Tax=Streptococcus acidominimus TaxID=1326 RepID=A0A1Q8EA68_STRAI|nr:hypothetical protein BU200_09715 [Streptococcus acidominimus]SUN06245.1 Uncharacterised protein [Streptococcus acidominimus]
MFFPLVWVVNIIYSMIVSRAYHSAATNDKSNEYRSKGQALLRDPQFLQSKSIIPSNYFNIDDLYLLYAYLENYRADNFKEAANLLAEERHRHNVEYSQQVMQQSLESIKGNLQYQSVIQTIQLLETKNMNSKLDSIGSQMSGIQGTLSGIFRRMRE